MRKRKPVKKVPQKISIRKVSMSELSEADRELIRKGLAQSEAGQTVQLQVKNPKGFKVTATQQVMDAFKDMPEGAVKQMLQHIVNDTAAQKRRGRTKAKLKYDVKVKPCKTCYGHGMWLDGTAPMGPIDASDGMPTSACPECKKNPNPSRKK